MAVLMAVLMAASKAARKVVGLVAELVDLKALKRAEWTVDRWAHG